MAEISKKYSAKPSAISEILKSNNVRIKRSRSKNRLVKEDYFSCIDSEEKSYFLGLMFTDGSVINDNTRNRSPMIRLELSEKDKDVLDKFKDAIGIDAALKYSKRKGKSATFSVGFRSEIMANDLAKYGIVQNKTERTYKLPDNIPKEWMTSFLRGVIDGDGSLFYSKNTWHINFTAHYKSMVESFIDVCDKIIGKSRRYKVTCSNNVYKVTYNGRWAKDIANKCYANSKIHMARKYRLAMAILEDKTVEDIVYSASKDVG